MAVDLISGVQGTALRFAWPNPVSAAVFARGTSLWVVFGRPAKLDLAAVQTPRTQEAVGDIRQVPGPAAAVRLTPPNGAFAMVRRIDNAWIIDLQSDSAEPQAAARVVVPPEAIQEAGAGADAAATATRLLIDLPQVADVLRIKDPEIGDELIVAPTAEPGYGVIGPRDFVQFRLLQTVQGVALMPKADGLNVRSMASTVEVTHPTGLWVSRPRAGRDRTEGNRQTLDPKRQLFDFARWQKRGPAHFVEDRTQLLQAVSSARPAQRSAARLDLARFLFAHGQTADALGLLRVMQQDDPKLLETPELKALRGASLLLMGDLRAARRQLDHPDLADHPEVALWRAALFAGTGEPGRAVIEYGQGALQLDSYPPPIANRLRLAIVDALIESGNTELANAVLQQVTAADPDPRQKAEVDYRRARILAADGQAEPALKILDEVMAGNNRSAQVKAAATRMDLKLASGEMSLAEAITGYDRLRFAWRGDETELLILRRLAALQLKSGDQRAGLTTLRQILTYFPDRPESKEAAEAMRQTFAALYLDGAADKLPPLTAIGLFEEFRDLVPTGEKGEAMMRRLADRMVKVDLLDRAGNVLQQLMQAHEAGPERTEVGTKLALVRLLDRQPQAALDALTASDDPNLAAPDRRERQRLAARALSDLGKDQEALARLDGDDEEVAQRLRLEIHAKNQAWAQMAPILERLAGEPAPESSGGLAEAQAQTAIDWAATLVLAQDKAGLERLRTRFGKTFASGPYAEMYRVLTADRPGTLPEDMAAVAARVKAAVPYQSFLAKYRERLAAAPAKTAAAGGGS